MLDVPLVPRTGGLTMSTARAVQALALPAWTPPAALHASPPLGSSTIAESLCRLAWTTVACVPPTNTSASVGRQGIRRPGAPPSASGHTSVTLAALPLATIVGPVHGLRPSAPVDADCRAVASSIYCDMAALSSGEPLSGTELLSAGGTPCRYLLPRDDDLRPDTELI